MPAERAPMRKVREVLRLRHALGVSERQIAVTIGVSRSTVGEYLRRAAVIGITWPVPEGLDDAELERRSSRHRRSTRRRHGRCPIGPRPQGAETARRDAVPVSLKLREEPLNHPISPDRTSARVRSHAKKLTSNS